MFVGITIICIVVGLLVASATEQGRARREIQRLGGYVIYEDTYVYSGQPLSYRRRLLEPLTRFVDTDLLLPITFVGTPYLEETSLLAQRTLRAR